jgi:hypothetical protein
VDLYSSKTWSLTLREEHRLGVIDSRVLKGIFGSKWDEVTGGWRKLNNEELRDFYSSPSIIRMIKSRSMRCGGHVARMQEKRNEYRLVVRKQEGKKHFSVFSTLVTFKIFKIFKITTCFGLNWPSSGKHVVVLKILKILKVTSVENTEVFQNIDKSHKRRREKVKVK